ncbi:MULTISPECIES: DUF4198 domain-containing protein [unclassified Campylobacter]|uniref:DUF4198 domain-containing protein n=1 Tax=unclassified Campylobacter TaxID=2593542 RepID=UPI0022E9A748|nr:MULTISPECIES: DUF4198 domain-containing protein [unclassified Campylobacter]MDA3055226.1 DUF4198 domain-containing protein [Campylobacter sp. VBCF_07 NA4]MDA3061478.1 DUF4198 domain-containing protein [Campylobacter sp. VBCF_02 NA5]MDA3070995.1 DUF4198 domain-containing protein [Campylobacter sp. VBCF_08 NA3]WBR53929.1 DUF4198 domain-containing protein [Campylobacter sp. VBCF_01 NA2]
MKFKILSLLTCAATASFAHFGVVLADSDTIEDESKNKLNLVYEFTHPFEQNRMNLEIPNVAEIWINGEKKPFLQNLKAQKEGENAYFTAEFEVKEPGVYQFYFDPKPYFEPAEGKFIRHQSKTIIDAYGYGEGWDEPVGLKAEIVPLTRPFGLYAGNSFCGTVLYKNTPAKGVEVEVEYYNKSALKAPSEDHITQVVKTNANGEFCFTMPLSGHWGFAALIDDDEKIAHEGKEYGVELGAVLWVQTKDYEK